MANHEVKKFDGQLQILETDLDKIYIAARDHFQKRARETLKLFVANHKIKKYHGQRKL